ncbi:MAG: hypothetical protein K2P18_02770, partial [Oscillospiraceae bacterium]|nr:hypothetical protein [Oscillospiraceae bacterium]
PLRPDGAGAGRPGGRPGAAPRLLRDFDLILCNPPYIPTLEIPRLDPSVRDYEPHIALDGGEDGLKFYRAVAKKWKRALKPGGKLAFEVGFDQAPAVEYILAEHGYQDIQTTLDPGMHWRVVEGRIEDGTGQAGAAGSGV